MATNPEIPSSNPKNSELLAVENDLHELQNEVKEAIESSVTKAPYEKNGAIIFDYNASGNDWEIVTRKEGNTYKVRVKKRIKPSGRQTQHFDGKETHNFEATDLRTFNNELGKALTNKIGSNREKLPKTGKIVYNMLLNLGNKNTNNPEIKTNDSGDKPNDPKVETEKDEIKQNEPDTKPKENEIKPEEANTEPKKEKIDTQQPEIGKFKYENISKDRNDYIFSYVVGSEIKSYWTILNEFGKEFKLKSTNGITITDSKGNGIRRPLKNEKIYIKIPKYCIETNTRIIDNMKCKGGEFFGIDVSRFNNGVGRLKGESDNDYKKRCAKCWNDYCESFKKRNREKWDSLENDKRGVSFIYVRAGDGHPNADPGKDKESIENWMNFIKNYNNDKTVKDEHEQLATGFYWTLTNQTNVKSQAQNFLKIYNKYKDIPGGNNLVPMLDLETDRFNEFKKSYKNKRGKRVTENYTPKEFKENALQRLKYIEEETGIIPGIYIGAKAYGDYIKGDSRFDKYLTWFTAYPSEDGNGREIGTAPRINFKEGSVNVGSPKEPVNVKPTMYQSSQEGTIPGTSAKKKERDGKTYEDTDMDHTKNITKLFSKNNKSEKTTPAQ